MAILNARAGTLGLKIVYVGPAYSGKTTNLQVLHRSLPEDRRGRLTSLAGNGDRTLFFDFMAFELGVVAGLSTHFHLYTVPGQPELAASRRAVLRGADGLIVVMDSDPRRLPENRQSLADLDQALKALGADQAAIPRVYQFNKRDLPDAIGIFELDRELNPGRWPAFPATAIEGAGVQDCLRAIFKIAIAHIGRSRVATPSPGTPIVALRPRSPLAGPGRPPSRRPSSPVRRPRWTSSPV